VRSSSANFFFLTLPHTKKENRMQKPRKTAKEKHSDFKKTEGKPETKTKIKIKSTEKQGIIFHTFVIVHRCFHLRLTSHTPNTSTTTNPSSEQATLLPIFQFPPTTTTTTTHPDVSPSPNPNTRIPTVGNTRLIHRQTTSPLNRESSHCGHPHDSSVRLPRHTIYKTLTLVAQAKSLRLNPQEGR